MMSMHLKVIEVGLALNHQDLVVFVESNEGSTGLELMIPAGIGKAWTGKMSSGSSTVWGQTS